MGASPLIVAGIIWSSRYIYGRRIVARYDQHRQVATAGLEVLVAADIVKTIAVELTFASLGLLAGFSSGAHLPKLDSGS